MQPWAARRPSCWWKTKSRFASWCAIRLLAKGYQVLEAENGEAGLAAAARHQGKIDLVITDVVMPGMGGRELVKQLTETRPETKVLYLSGYTEDAIISDGSIESGTAFLQKPFTLQSLSRKVT